MRLIYEECPRWIIASPPCTDFCVRNFAWNHPKMPADEVDRRLREAMLHIKFVCKRYRHQLRHGRYFLHEHPRSARSWKTQPIQHVLKNPSVHVTTCHQCQYGATTHCDGGSRAPILKPTRFMSNSILMLKRPSKLCKRDHVHQGLLSGRAAAAAFFIYCRY